MCIHPDAVVDSWGPVMTDPKEDYWLETSSPTNNTGELSAIYHALQVILAPSRQAAQAIIGA